MPTLEEQHQREAEAEAEHLRALAERDKWLGNPWRRRQAEEAERRERRARVREALLAATLSAHGSATLGDHRPAVLHEHAPAMRATRRAVWTVGI